MATLASDRFVRVPSELLDALLNIPLSGSQWRILLWVIRHTYGWNRITAPFSWYRIASDLAMDRGGVVRSGNRLLRAGILFGQDGRLGIQKDRKLWEFGERRRRDNPAQLSMLNISADRSHRKPMTRSIASDDGRHRNRCQESSVFRRAIDSSKDRLKTNKDMHPRKPDDSRQCIYDSAGAARPIPGKYDRISQN